MSKPVSIFLSAVSKEFHNPDPADPRRFLSYRETLAESLHAIRQPHTITMCEDILRRIDPDTAPGHLAVVSQENLTQGPADLLSALEDEVRDATAIVHLVGDMAGAEPGETSLRRLRERHPDFLAHEPELRKALGDWRDITFTQWELWFAFHHRAARFIFIAAESAPRSPSFALDMNQYPLQQEHIARIQKTDEHYAKFTDQSDVTRQTIHALIRRNLIDDPATAEPDPEALEHARTFLEKIVPEIVASIKKPDPAKVFLPDRAGVAAWLAAIDTAAAIHGLNRNATLTLLDERLAYLLEKAEATRDPAIYLKLGFTTLAIGEYPAAITAAESAITGATALRTHDPDPETLRQQHILNAYLLLHDASAANHDPSRAIQAIADGGIHINKAKDPVAWADYHEPVADYLVAQAEWEQADNLISDILAIREENAAKDGNALARTLCAWVLLLNRTGRHLEAHDVARQAAVIFSKQTPPNNTGQASAWNNQAMALFALGRYTEAEPLMRRALAIDEASFGESHPNVSRDLNNLALLLKTTSRLAEAEPLMRRALAIDEASYGDSHPDVAIRLGNLAQLLHATNRLAEAEPLMRRALAINEASYGDSHPDVATALNNLALLLHATNRLAKAELLMRRALAIDEASYGDSHPDVARDLNNLARLLQDTNRLAEAEPLIRRALAIDEASYGDSHPNVAIRLGNLAALLKATNRFGEAEPLMRRMMEIFLNFTRDTGHRHPHLVTAINNYAGLLMAMSDTQAQAVEKINAIMKPYGMSV